MPQNYLGGVADVLEGKSRRGKAVEHLGDLAHVWLYRNDRQITHITYSRERAVIDADHQQGADGQWRRA